MWKTLIGLPIFWVCWSLTLKRKNGLGFFPPEGTELCRRGGKSTLIVRKLTLKLTQANQSGCFFVGVVRASQNPVLFLRLGCSTHPAHIVDEVALKR